MDKALQLRDAESEAKGRAEGRAEGQAHLMLRLLKRRFTDFPPSAHDRLAQASPAELEAWFDTAFDAPSLEAVFQAKPKVH